MNVEKEIEQLVVEIKRVGDTTPDGWVYKQDDRCSYLLVDGVGRVETKRIDQD
jgi:hypothetical protein